MTVRLALEAAFWLAAGLLIYSYVVFPALVMAIGARRKAADGAPVATAAPPAVAVVVAAFNEERHIEERIRNLLAQDYPAERLRILVGSDGSSDRTVEIARRFEDPRVEVHAFAVNRGKASVLNDLVAAAAPAEIVVFTDANTHFAADAVRLLVEAIGRGSGAVCGELVLEKPAQGANRDDLYWSHERRLKLAEARIGGLVGANGGVYAIRRELYRPIPPRTICDDFVISMRIATAGEGLAYEPRALAYEETPADVAAEFGRRSRIGIGNYQALFGYPEFLLRGPWALRFTYFSHKVLRWLTPHLLLTMLAASLALCAEPLYLGLALLQLAGYGMTLAAYATRDRIAWPTPVLAAVLFALLNVAFLVAFKRYLHSDYGGRWTRTART